MEMVLRVRVHVTREVILSLSVIGPASHVGRQIGWRYHVVAGEKELERLPSLEMRSGSERPPAGLEKREGFPRPRDDLYRTAHRKAATYYSYRNAI